MSVEDHKLALDDWIVRTFRNGGMARHDTGLLLDPPVTYDHLSDLLVELDIQEIYDRGVKDGRSSMEDEKDAEYEQAERWREALETIACVAKEASD